MTHLLLCPVQSRPDVSEIQPVPDAVVPVLSLKVRGQGQVPRSQIGSLLEIDSKSCGLWMGMEETNNSVHQAPKSIYTGDHNYVSGQRCALEGFDVLESTCQRKN